MSVILASHLGADRIATALESLRAQTLPMSRFEVVVSCNGPDDGTSEVVDEFVAANPGLRATTVTSQVADLGTARNLALDAASFAYFTILDDDDWLSPTYLEAMLARCAPDTIALTYMANVAAAGSRDKPNFSHYLGAPLFKWAGLKVPAWEIPVLTEADGGKAAPTELARRVRYDEGLLSGLDVVFWLRLAAHGVRWGTVLPLADHAFYYRSVRTGSISRRSDDLFVQDRFTVIRRMLEVAEKYPPWRQRVEGAVKGQCTHLGRVAYQRPEILDELASRISAFATPAQLRAFNHQAARKLAVCYMYLPYNDPSAITAAKRLRLAQAPFDVICHDLSAVRACDASLRDFDQASRGNLVRLEGRDAFLGARGISAFCERGVAAWQKLERDHGHYFELYSRHTWPASHALAALIKTRQPDINWTAEFSDPLSVTVEGVQRGGNLANLAIRREVEEAIARAGFNPGDAENLGQWLELAVYALADHVLFTNPNQRAVMLRAIKDPALARRVEAVALVEPHPGAPAELVASGRSAALASGRVNLGYFGRFYAGRGIGAVLNAVTQLPPAERRRLALHLFLPADQLQPTRGEIRLRGAADAVFAHSQVGYADFLATAAAMDWLLVTDTRAAAFFGGVNPYLPSKYADYASVGTNIWGIVEPGSPMASLPLDERSELDDPADTLRALRAILTRH
jgi:hypothetical protein